MSAKGKIVEAKVIKSGCGSACRYGCHLKLAEDDRLPVKNAFYRLTQTRKWD